MWQTLPAFVLCGLVAVAAAGQPLPAAPSEPVTEVIHGVSLTDPYRNLEDLGRPDTRAWLDAAGREAAARLAAIDGRDALAERIAALARSAGDVVRDVRRMPGGRLYYLKRAAGESQFKLMTRTGVGGAERVLVDPVRLAAATGVPHALNWFQPSWDGRMLAYGISAGGSEDTSLQLLDIATGRPIGKPVPRVHEALVDWSPDSRFVTFNQLRELGPGAAPTETFLDSAVLVLRPGGSVMAPARPIFGPLATPALGLARLDVGSVVFSPDSRFMIARTTDTTVPEGRLFVAPVSELARTTVRWRPIATAADEITDVQLRGDTLYLRSRLGAPRGRILALDLARLSAQAPPLSGAREVVAEPVSGVLGEFVLGRDALFAEVFEGFATRVRRFPTGARVDAAPVAGVDVAPALAGSAFVVPDPAHRDAGVWLRTQGWTQPPRLVGVSPDGTAADTGLMQSAAPPGVPDIEVTEVLVPSHDGAQVPLTVLHARGLVRDGRAPTLLTGYGAYGLPEEPFFDPRALAWLESGGVIARAKVRGGGAFGDAWHRAGFKASKPNTWKDGIACARWLIDHGYTTPKTLGIWGTSAGGIFVGRAVTEAPELFAAAIFDVGVLDAVRAEESANGITNISEFGTAKDPAEFRALLEMSTYHHIRPGTAYPAVLLIHGLNDPRVDVWHSAKTAARLQAAAPPDGSGRPVLLRLDGQAGHGVGSTAQQANAKVADIDAFLLWQFGRLKAAGDVKQP